MIDREEIEKRRAYKRGRFYKHRVGVSTSLPRDEADRRRLMSDDQLFNLYLVSELLRVPDTGVLAAMPTVRWLAERIFEAYWPNLVTVDFRSPVWARQLRNFDFKRLFGWSDVHARLRRVGGVLSAQEHSILDYVLNPAPTQIEHINLAPPDEVDPPLILEGFHNPRIIPSPELLRSLSMTGAQVKARRRLTRDELASGCRPRHRPGRHAAFTLSGRLKHMYFKKEGTGS